MYTTHVKINGKKGGREGKRREGREKGEGEGGGYIYLISTYVVSCIQLYMFQVCQICPVLFVVLRVWGAGFLSPLSGLSWLVCYAHVFPCIYVLGMSINSVYTLHNATQ